MRDMEASLVGNRSKNQKHIPVYGDVLICRCKQE